MTRVLVFDGQKAAKRFELLWTALVAGGDGKGERTPVVIRREARLQDLLESIGHTTNGSGPTLKEEGVSLTMTQEDFDFLSTYTEKVMWNPLHSRHVVDLWDWLSTAEKRE